MFYVLVCHSGTFELSVPLRTQIMTSDPASPVMESDFAAACRMASSFLRH